MGEEKAKPAGVWPTVKPFVNGGASGMLATCVIQPIDMIKVRIQLGQGSAGQVMRTMLKNEGIRAFYKAWSISPFMRFARRQFSGGKWNTSKVGQVMEIPPIRWSSGTGLLRWSR
ncbi:hypothetical protein RJ639_015347 [Escallonia herrerae]|uniref:Uncharacterized protein n=1 Tax=Escallonia herrerae TaxID=1293975 RepID=A0AA89APD5_9ASTE|nr:hypothetical protein RJ639_015347 [Escallonia herrerae]